MLIARIALAGTLLPPVLAQIVLAPPAAKPKAKVKPAAAEAGNDEIRKLFDEDQADRSGDPTPAQWEEINRRDAARRERLRTLIAQPDRLTGEDLHHAAFIFQHGDKPEDYLLAHILAVQSIAKGYSRSLWISAATLDRYLKNIGQPQVFGTQYHTGSDGNFTQEPYQRTLLNDAQRQAFCVNGIPGQERNVAALRAGKPFPSPDRCP